MYFISHRGNLYGKKPDMENKPSYVKAALLLGFDVEIDVWVDNELIYLGHDKPQYLVDLNFLENNKLWCHAKNYKAIDLMIKNKKIHCFWHQKDDYTITSRGFVWCYPGHNKFKNCIDVMPELTSTILENYCFKGIGVCSDFVQKIRRSYNEK